MTSGKMSAFKWESCWNQLKWQSSWIRGMNWHKTSPIAFVQLHQSWEIISTFTIVQIEPREIDSLNYWFHKRGWKLNNKGKQIDKSGPSCYLILGLYFYNTAQTGWSNLRDVHSCFPKRFTAFHLRSKEDWMTWGKFAYTAQPFDTGWVHLTRGRGLPRHKTQRRAGTKSFPSPLPPIFSRHGVKTFLNLQKRIS